MCFHTFDRDKYINQSLSEYQLLLWKEWGRYMAKPSLPKAFISSVNMKISERVCNTDVNQVGGGTSVKRVVVTMYERRIQIGHVGRVRARVPYFNITASRLAMQARCFQLSNFLERTVAG